MPLVFPDPLALRILGATADGRGLSDLRAPARASSVALRAYLVARSRFAEDALRTAVQAARVTQYVLLGAGLDTFGYRNPYPRLQVYEVDHPATQAWKLSLLQQASIAIPLSVTYVPVDFRQDDLLISLANAGFDGSRPALFAWMGVVPYLHASDFTSTLQQLSAAAPGSTLLLDYSVPRELLPELEQRAFDSLAARVAAAGEPFQGWYRPQEMHQLLLQSGWQVSEDLHRDAINERYFAGRADQLRCLGSGGRFLAAVLR